jgi:serine O-acetyltransferase
VSWLSDYKSDVRRYAEHGIEPPLSVLKTQGLWALLQYRVAHRYGRNPLARPALFAWRLAVESLAGISIDSRAEIGPSCYIGHFGGVFVGEGVKIGARCNISHGVTIGVHRGGSPTIGSGCGIGPGAVVVGGITIGDNVMIGANAIVSGDLPDGAMVRAAAAQVTTSRPSQAPLPDRVGEER